MSHFTVMIVGENPEGQLIPFQENNMGNCPEEYMKFNDTEEEMLKEYNEESSERVIMPDGRLLSTVDNEFRVKDWKITSPSQYEIPKDLPTKNIPFKEIYTSFEQFVKDWHGREERDKETNRYGYWENPNAKWDWYQLGGRWTGFFKLKSGKPGSTGEPGLMTKEAKKGFADTAYKKDIDFEYMRKKAADNARETYEMVESEFENGIIPNIDILWKDIIDNENEKYSKIDIKEKRELYHNQPAMMQWKSKADKYRDLRDVDEYFKKVSDLFIWGDLSDYQCTKEEYIQKAVDGAISTFAVVMDGKWYARGEMGWWASVSGEKNNWNEEFSKLLESISGDTLLSIYDCHI